MSNKTTFLLLTEYLNLTQKTNYAKVFTHLGMIKQFSKSYVYRLVSLLERAGYVKRNPYKIELQYYIPQDLTLPRLVKQAYAEIQQSDAIPRDKCTAAADKAVS